MKPVNEVGPLPKVKPSAQLEKKSIIAFKAALPHDLFVVRDEIQGDYGVDITVELIRDGCATNFRSQIQLKSTASDRLLGNGSFPLAIETSNLNYLLNQGASLYVLFLAGANELRYIWVRDVLANIPKDWASQKTLTLHFITPLDQSSVSSIWSQVYNENELARSVRDKLQKSAAGPITSLFVNVANSTATDENDITSLLAAQGMAQASAGKAAEVHQLFSKLSTRPERMTPNVILCGVYSNYLLGRYVDAHRLMPYLRAKRDKLTSALQDVASNLEDSCLYELGQISQEDYIARLSTTKCSDSPQRRFYAAHHARLAKRDIRGRSPDSENLKKAFEEVMALGEGNDAIKIQARTMYLTWSYSETNLNLATGIAAAKLCAEKGKPVSSSAQKLIDSATQGVRETEEKWSLLWEDSKKIGHPVLQTDVVVAHAGATTRQLSLTRRMGLDNPLDAGVLARLEERLTWAIGAYDALGSTLGIVRCVAVRCEVLYLQGQDSKMKDLANEYIPVAEAMQMPFVSLLRGYADGRSLLERDNIEGSMDDDFDVVLSKMNKDELERYARQGMDIGSLPEESYQGVLGEYMRAQFIAKERLSWCEGLTFVDIATEGPDSSHRLLQPVSVVCVKRDLQSVMVSKSLPALTAAFKTNVCATCGIRERKNPGRESS